MKKILFCSHARLCEGMLDTLKVFTLYDEKTMQAIPFYTEGVDSVRLLEEAAAQGLLAGMNEAASEHPAV